MRYDIRFSIILPLLLLLPGLLISQITQKAEHGMFALMNGTVVTVTNGNIENGIVLIQDGAIVAVADRLNIPTEAVQIDCSGKFIYPGFIDGGTQLGLNEVGSISLTRDGSEIGEVIPQMQALTAVNPNSVSIPVTRVNGITTVLTVPSGGLFPGTAALINLFGYTPDQMYAGFKGVVMRYPRSGRRGRWDRRSDEEIKKAEKEALKKLNETWEDAALYARIDSAAQAGGTDGPGYNPALAALAPVVRGEAHLLVEVNREKDILKAIDWVKEKGVQQIIFTGVREGWRVADSLAAADIPVITGPVLSTPTRANDRYDKPYANAGIMQQAGVQVAIRTNESENVRNLPYHAGFAATYGMGKEEALKAVTIVPARIFGLEGSLGSIEEGKVANLFVCDGDPFETATQISHLFINGWKVPMESRHTQLYDEFLERKPGVED